MLPCHNSFLKVEAEAVPEVSERLEIAMVPSFVLMKVITMTSRTTLFGYRLAW